jgi:hypothetical protein
VYVLTWNLLGAGILWDWFTMPSQIRESARRYRGRDLTCCHCCTACLCCRRCGCDSQAPKQQPPQANGNGNGHSPAAAAPAAVVAPAARAYSPHAVDQKIDMPPVASPLAPGGPVSPVTPIDGPLLGAGAGAAAAGGVPISPLQPVAYGTPAPVAASAAAAPPVVEGQPSLPIGASGAVSAVSAGAVFGAASGAPVEVGLAPHA